MGGKVVGSDLLKSFELLERSAVLVLLIVSDAKLAPRIARFAYAIVNRRAPENSSIIRMAGSCTAMAQRFNCAANGCIVLGLWPPA